MSTRSAANALPEGALAVVGLAGRFPGAGSVDELWENLCAGREGVRFFKPEELDPSIPVSVRADPKYVRARGIIEDCDKFDAGFFDISPLEAQIMDPQQRIMLELAWSALENAGHPPSQFPGLIGVYVGMNWTRYRANCLSAHPEVIARFGELNTALANEPEFLATRISYKLNLRGPSVTVGTACSTSLVAIAQASQSLLNFECDLALAGGVSVTVPVNAGYLYQEGSMLSADGHCRAFDAHSTGTTFNDGAGLVVLRRLEDAIRDGDRIYAVVRGFAVNNDGSSKVSFTAPSVNGQVEVIRSALEHADVDPATIGLIEAHGTATPLGDPIEVAALKRVFSDAKSRSARCVLGSVKSSVGHLIHAAGVTGFIKAVLSVYHGKIPPTLFFETPNPRLGLDDSPFRVNTKLEEWTTSGHPRRAGVSAFGVGGTNAHVIVEEPPQMKEGTSSGLPRVICLSAKSEDALARQMDDLKRFLAAHEDSLSLDSVAYTLHSGREALQHRAAFAVRSVADAIVALDDKRRAVRGKAASDRSITFMFTGQGAQRTRMGQWLYDGDASFRECFDEGAERLKSRTGLDLRLQVFSDSAQAEQEVDQTRIAQPALFLLEYSLARMLERRGIVPATLLGHSIGEFVAATLAGIFTFEDALYVVAKRGEAMQSMPSGSMLVVHCSEARVQSLVTADICLAAVNAPELCVLAGPDAAIASLAAKLDSQGMRSKRLRTSHAFHSSMMDPAIETLRSVLAGVPLSAPRRALISTVTGRPLSAEEATNPEYWARQLRETVRFTAALNCLAEQGNHALLEVGPGSTLTTLSLQHKRADRWVAMAVLPGSGLQESADLEVLSAVAHCWATGARVDWQPQWADTNPRRTPLPAYSFARKRYWLDPVPQQEVAATVAQLPASVPDSTSNSEPTSMNSTDRLAALERRVIKVLEDTSGFDLANANQESSFAELGFNSLLLTQVSIALKQEFGVDVSFRALLEQCTSIRELTDYLANELPENATLAQEPAAMPVAQPQVATPMSTPTSVPVDLQSAPSDLKALIEKQLALMQLQLQVLGTARDGVSAQVNTPARPSTPAAVPATPVNTSQDKPQEQGGGDGAPKKHTPGIRIEKNRVSARQLTRAQQAYVDKLIESYAKSTAASKAFAQRHRRHLADPRTVSGFNPLWKEMIYPIVTNRSKGSRIWDLDGREYIDLTNGFGPVLFGHSPDFVNEAVIQQIARGIETGPQTPLAGEVAELFCELTGNERVAFANTGSEAVLAALRLARTVTGRDKVVTFEGAYHGIFDEVVVRAGRNGAGLPAAPGVPRSHVANMIVLPYGTDESLDRIRRMGKELAAVMVETVQSRHPGAQPIAFLKELRQLTEESGAALIFDEVVTGFRTHPGGIQALFDIRADLAVYGKVVAGGYPIGLVAGKSKFMDALDGGFWQFGDDSIPEIGVTFFAGTFVRHPVTLAATKAVLERMKAEGPALQMRLGERTGDMARELRTFLKEIGAKIALEEFSSYFYFSVASDEQYGSLLFFLLRLYGIHAWEFRPCFLTTSHTDEDIAAFKTAFIRAVSELVQHGLLQGDAVAVERLNKSRSGKPPVEGARLGKDAHGAPAWFVPDPDRPGKYVQVSNRR